MSKLTAVLGDIHGNLEALQGLYDSVRPRVDRVVFVGDYVNRGPDSSGVIQFLVDQAGADPDLVFLLGNHDHAFLDSLCAGALVPFLRIGGASTIRSYVRNPEGDVLQLLRSAVPAQHVRFLRELKPGFCEDNLLVTHDGSSVTGAGIPPRPFHVHGHVVQRSLSPVFGTSTASIDTGCGTLPSGRLTSFIWPTREVLQVGADGTALAATTAS